MQHRIEALRQDIRLSEQNRQLDDDPNARSHIAALTAELQHLEQKRYKNSYARAQARWFDKGETISKYWSATVTPKRPRDIIYSLADPTNNSVTTKSSKMTSIARSYHSELQNRDLLALDDPARTAAQTAVLREIPINQKLNDPESPLHSPISEEQLKLALRVSKNGTATGLDGIPYELWKLLHDTHLAQHKVNKPSFNILKCLVIVYNDIQLHGTDPNLDFSAGWMCPIYKKKDRTRIENYRPITLLNTDYKLMTQALATQLASHAGQLLHPDQSGFVPHRLIFDPIRLAETMCSYGDYMEENGAIVALDQEKAYDKIDHSYLLDTLRTFHLPDLFIDTVKALYDHARTKVAINGVMSDHYPVTRGVRQGDPLSCLLFNLAIEPLAASIRNSPDLEGFSIPGTTSKVTVNLYADDTTVYLSESDRYDTLEHILTQWCRASGAKFNTEKTEIIPIGTKQHRERILTTRRLHPDDHPLPENIRVAPDGHPTRCLGAWIGNDLDSAQPWTPTIEKIKRALDRWTQTNPSLDAKRLIIQLTVGSMTQFLAKAQGMPKTILKTLTKLTRDFIWNQRKSRPIALNRLCSPRHEGGINLLDLTSRNAAIETTWLQQYLNPSATRPTWAFVTDAIINCIKPTGIRTPDGINIFLTSLRPSTRSRNGIRPPSRLITLLNTAKDTHLHLAPVKLSRRLKTQLPAWFHVGVPPNLYRTTAADCLRTQHDVKTIRDLAKVSKRVARHTTRHKPHPKCACKHCTQDRERNCTNPHKCANLARNILGYLDPKFDPLTRPRQGQPLPHSPPTRKE